MGLLGSTGYSYRVRAMDTSSNPGPYSSVASATTAPPVIGAPSHLTAKAVNSVQITLVWAAATEAGGTISKYLIERCQGAGCTNFAQLTSVTGISYKNTGLLPTTTYTYRVRATDAANNLGPYSTLASATTSAIPTIVFVQGHYATPQAAQAIVTVTFTAWQHGGDLNVVVVGWNNSTATVKSVTDTKGNVYKLAVGPTVQSGVATQAIYYAKNIAFATAGANTVTVNFNGSAAYPDIRILEYSGIDIISPLDVTAAASGNSASSSSGAVTTRVANELIIGANLVQTHTTAAGSGFIQRMITVPHGDIVEDRTVTAIGSYAAAAPISPSAQWIMQLVTFKRGL
jgi:hypothetical protein